MRIGPAAISMVLVACAKESPPAPTPATPIPIEAPPGPRSAAAPAEPVLPPSVDPGSGCPARGLAHRLRNVELRLPGGAPFGRFYARAKVASLTVMLDRAGDAIVTIDEEMVAIRGAVATDDVPIHSKKSTPLAGVVFPTRWTAFRFVALTPEGVKAELPSTVGLPKLDTVIPCDDVTLAPPTTLDDDPFPVGDADLSFAVRTGKLTVSPSADAAPTLEFVLERSLAVMSARARKNGRVFARIETPPPGPVIVGYVPEKSLARNQKAQFFGDYIPPWATPRHQPLDGAEEGTEEVALRCSVPMPLIARVGGAGDRTIGTVKSGARVTLGEPHGDLRKVELPGVFEAAAGATLLVPKSAAAASCK